MNQITSLLCLLIAASMLCSKRTLHAQCPSAKTISHDLIDHKPSSSIEKLSEREICDQLEQQLAPQSEISYSNQELEQFLSGANPFAKYYAAGLLLRNNPNHKQALALVKAGLNSEKIEEEYRALYVISWSGRSKLTNVITEIDLDRYLESEQSALRVAATSILIHNSRNAGLDKISKSLMQSLDLPDQSVLTKPIYFSEYTFGSHEIAVSLLGKCGEAGKIRLEKIAKERSRTLAGIAKFILNMNDDSHDR